MKWMKSKEQECQIILESQKTEISTVSLDGSQTLMLSVRKTIMLDTLQTESILMDQWTITWPSTTLPWPTLNFSDKMLHQSLLQEKEFKPWAYKINQSMAHQWDQLRALSRHQFMLRHSFWTEISQINGKTLKKYRNHSSLQMPFLSLDSHILSGIRWPNLHEEEITKVQPKREVTLKEQTTLLHKDLGLRLAKRRELSKSEEKMDGTPTSNQSPSITKKFTAPWKSHLKESDLKQKMKEKSIFHEKNQSIKKLNIFS